MTISLEALLSGSSTVDWDDTAMSGTSKRVTEAVELGHRAREVSWQPAWTKTTAVTGAFGVELSNDGIKWTPAALATDFSAIGPAIDDNSDSQSVHGSFRARYARLTYTNATLAGALTNGVHVNGKRGVRGLVTGVKELAGASYAAHYRWDAYTPGTLPDIAIGTNLQGDAALNIEQSVLAQRPHLVGQSWDFNSAGSQFLRASGLATPVLASGSYATILCAGKFDVTSSDVLFDLSLGAATNNGLMLFANSGSFFARALVTTGGLKQVTVAADTDTHVFKASLRTDTLVLGVDGVETSAAAAANAGLLNGLDRITMGAQGNDGGLFDGQQHETVVLRGPSLAQEAAVEAYLMDRWL